jgi:acetyl-CoA carboxylase beta subunit
MTHPDARALIDSVVDPASFQSWDEPVDRSGYDAEYLAALKRAETKAGTDEAVLTGRASVRGHAVALVFNSKAQSGSARCAVDPGRNSTPRSSQRRLQDLRRSLSGAGDRCE